MISMTALLVLITLNPKQLEIIPLETGTKASLRGLHVVSADTIWASGTDATVLHSSDGGKTWRTSIVIQDRELDFRDIEQVDTQTVFVQSVGTGQSSRIYRSKDNGVSWQLVFTNPHQTGFFDGLAFWTPKQGVAYSDPVNGAFFLITTRDGGDSWAPLNSLPPSPKGEASFAASGTAIVVRPGGLLWFGTGGVTSRIFRSADYGRTWTVAKTALRQGQAPEGCFGMVFWDDLNGCAVGGRYNELDATQGTCVLTQDGGKTWTTPASNPSGFRSAVAHVSGAPGVTLVTVGPSGIDISTDGGNHWVRQTGDGFHSLGFVSGTKLGFASGYEGRIAKLNLF